MEPFRITPALPVTAMKTYGVSMPLATHWRPATCEEVDCGPFLNGWETAVDETTDLGQRQAHYIRHDRTRKATEARTEAGLTVFTFEAGQTCFRPHKVPSGRPERFWERGGDWRAATSARREFQRPEDWQESFATHQQQLADRLEAG